MTDRIGAPLRILAIGAHPDDCDIMSGGTAIKLARMGHEVKFLSTTNGDAGHPSQSGAALAVRRYAEAQEAAVRLGIACYEIFDLPDGALMPTLELRHALIRAIREWRADIVISHRPNDYHPDHRYTGSSVQDCAFLVAVSHIVPDTPALTVNPIFLYFQDRFRAPVPFRPDLVIPIDDVWGEKIHALDAMPSQFYEFMPAMSGVPYRRPYDIAELDERMSAWLANDLTPEVRAILAAEVGETIGADVRHAEAFELSEYGTVVSRAELWNRFSTILTTARA